MYLGFIFYLQQKFAINPYLNSHSLVTHYFKGYLGFLFICIYKGIVVNMQGYTKTYE